jgi:hypothetical protein
MISQPGRVSVRLDRSRPAPGRIDDSTPESDKRRNTVSEMIDDLEPPPVVGQRR